ncbi:MAG: AsnC family transcriptional regulator, partial [Candidatus Nanopelagicales bacterium]
MNPLSGRYLRRSAITCQTPPVEANARTDRGEPLGDIDARILRLLASDGRMSYADLARETGLS